MKLSEKIEKDQGIRAILIIAIIISLGIIIGIFFSNRSRFDNDQLFGNYTGTIIFPDLNDNQYSLNITFDGIGEFTGYIENNSTKYIVENTQYTCLENYVDFSFSVNKLDAFFSLNGDISSDYSRIEGECRYLTPSDDTIEGNFLITK